jgi:diguanylate cyclase (GGDEF)-like protein
MISPGKYMMEHSEQAANMYAGSKKILMIEDDQADRRLITENLSRDQVFSEWTVIECVNAAEGLKKLRREKFDCVLLDYRLPDHNGLGILKEFRLYDSETPVIMLTGKGSENVAVEALKCGAQDYITKHDISGQALADVIGQAMQRRSAEIALVRKANFDPLTGLVNRNQLLERIDQAIARSDRTRRPFAVMYLDLNGFKAVNDIYGHAVGDALIKDVADRLKQSLRGCDTAARMGGDEFVVIMEDLTDDGAQCCGIVAARTIDKINQPYFIDGTHICVTASMGIAIYPLMAAKCDELLSLADKAMYEAKRGGGVEFKFATAA